MHIGLAIVGGITLLPLAPVVYLLMWLYLAAQYQRAQTLERSILGLKIGSFFGYWWKSVVFGLIVGIILSGGIYLVRHYFLFDWPAALSWQLWALLVVLLLIDVRLADIAYAGPLLIALIFIMSIIPNFHYPWQLSDNQMRSLLLVTGGAQLLSGLLEILNWGQMSSPIFVQSRRGQVVGMFVIQAFRPIPLLLPYFGALMPVAVFTGISGYTLSSENRRLMRMKGLAIALTGLLVLAGAIFWGTGITGLLVTAVVPLLLRIGLLNVLQLLDKDDLPIYVRPARGVRALATLDHSPARQLGIQPGEIIVKIGNIPVNSPYDIHFAIDQNPAYVKLEVVDMRGESRFIGTPIFADGPSQLGVIVVPDEHLHQYREVYEMGRWNWIWRWWAKNPSKSKKSYQRTTIASRENQTM